MRRSTLAVLVLIGLCCIVGFMSTSCTCTRDGVYESRMQFHADTSLVVRSMVADSTWAKFEACIDEHPSDWVCDSCWKVIIEEDYYKTHARPE